MWPFAMRRKAATAKKSRERRLVRVVGLEPTLLAEPDFESGASTSFTTPAQVRLKAAQSSDGAPWRKRSMTGAVAFRKISL